MTRLMSAAHAAPGHVASELQRPDALHPDEWVVIYRFADIECRQGWLVSDVRRELMHEASELVEGEPREQILALPSGSSDVRAFISVQVTSGCEERYYELHCQIQHAMKSFKGFRNFELLQPVAGVQTETVSILTFSSQKDLEYWLNSEVREYLVSSIDPLIDDERTMSIVGGFGGWFEASQGEAETRRWKQAAVVLMALFPTVLMLTVLRRWLLPDIPLVPGVLLSNIIGVAILTWGLMPRLTRRFDAWLSA